MEWQEDLVPAVNGILERARSADLEAAVVTEADMYLSSRGPSRKEESISAVIQNALGVVELLTSKGEAEGMMVSNVCALSRCCLNVAVEAGLSSPEVVELLAAGIAISASLFLRPDKNMTPEALQNECLTGLLEPLGEVLDGFSHEIFQSLECLEKVLQPRARDSIVSFSSLKESRDSMASLSSIKESREMRLYQDLQGMCFWVLALAIRAVGHEKFTARHLWEFASGNAFSAIVFSKCALRFQQWRCNTSRMPIPHDLEEVRGAILASVLGLPSQDVAFLYSEADGSIDVKVQNEFLMRHRAALAKPAMQCLILPCLLAYPWEGESTGPTLLPTFLAFVVALIESTFPSLPDKHVDLWSQHVRQNAENLWSITVSVPPSVIKRSFMRDCAALAFLAPPSRELSGTFIERCLSSEREALIADSHAVAALVVFSTNAGRSPTDDALKVVISELETDFLGRVGACLRCWRGRVLDNAAFCRVEGTSAIFRI